LVAQNNAKLTAIKWLSPANAYTFSTKCRHHYI